MCGCFYNLFTQVRVQFVKFEDLLRNVLIADVHVVQAVDAVRHVVLDDLERAVKLQGEVHQSRQANLDERRSVLIAPHVALHLGHRAGHLIRGQGVIRHEQGQLLLNRVGLVQDHSHLVLEHEC